MQQRELSYSEQVLYCKRNLYNVYSEIQYTHNTAMNDVFIFLAQIHAHTYN